MDSQGIQTGRMRQPKLTLSGAVRTNAVLVGANADIVEAAKAQMSSTSFMVSKKNDAQNNGNDANRCVGTRFRLARGRFSKEKDFLESFDSGEGLKLPPMTA
jgi:hypothetical protein